MRDEAEVLRLLRVPGHRALPVSCLIRGDRVYPDRSHLFSKSEPPAETKEDHVKHVTAVATASHSAVRLPSTSVGT